MRSGAVAWLLRQHGLKAVALGGGGTEALEAQAAQSATYAQAMRSSHAVVVEFYSRDCRHCRGAASRLAELSASHPSVDWVMVDCQNPTSLALVEEYGVGPIPHFAVLDAQKHTTRTEVGDRGARRLEAAIRDHDVEG